MAQDARHFFTTFGFFHEPSKHHHVPSRERERIDDVALDHSHIELVRIIWNLLGHASRYLGQRYDCRAFFHHLLVAEKVSIRCFTQFLLPLYRYPAYGHFDKEIRAVVKSQHHGQDRPADEAPDQSVSVAHLSHLLRNLCKRKTEMRRDRFTKCPNDVRIFQIQNPLSILPSPFHNKLV